MSRRRREAEIDHTRDAVDADDDVVRLDVTVDDRARVRGLEADTHLQQHGELVHLQGGFAATGDGWDLTGTFIAPHCRHLDIACPMTADTRSNEQW